MPNLDGGHYFLTALVPVLSDPVKREDGSITAASHALREALASLPTAAQSAACVASGRRSPFGRCRRTHFARLAVIDQPAFNGRDPSDAVLQSLRGTDLLVPQTVDCLACPWLLVAIDFDANADPDHGLDLYLQGLWRVMEPELRAVFRYCHGFETISSGQDFARYLRSCQIETTMPFNDYWTTPFAPPALSLGALARVFGGIFAMTSLILLLLMLFLLTPTIAWLWLGVPVALGVAVAGTYAFVMRRGARPFPAAPGSDLPTILKALFLKQRFTQFAAEHQLADAEALHAAFGQFLDDCKPGDLTEPTREPGVIAA